MEEGNHQHFFPVKDSSQTVGTVGTVEEVTLLLRVTGLEDG